MHAVPSVRAQQRSRPPAALPPGVTANRSLLAHIHAQHTRRSKPAIAERPAVGLYAYRGPRLDLDHLPPHRADLARRPIRPGSGPTAQCSNNLKQFGLALHAYHDAFGSLPPGRIKSYDPRYSGPNPPCTSSIVDKSIEVFAFGFMEQNAAYNAINQSLAIIGGENSTVHAVVISTFACPSDPASGVPRNLNPGALTKYGVPDPARMVFTSYAGMMGSLPVLAQPLPSTNCGVPVGRTLQCNGVFNDLSPMRLASVTDGLSNTIFMAEKATTILQELSAVNSQFPAEHGWYITGNWGDTLVTALYPPNACDKVGLIATNAWTTSASSMHPGGVNLLMGDGSVRFVKDSIGSWPSNPINGDPTGASLNGQGVWVNLPPAGIWQSLSTRAGGEVVSADSY